MSRNSRELSISSRNSNARYEAPRVDRRGGKQSYDPILPVMVAKRSASARSGHGIYWRERDKSARTSRREA